VVRGRVSGERERERERDRERERERQRDRERFKNIFQFPFFPFFLHIVRRVERKIHIYLVVLRC